MNASDRKELLGVVREFVQHEVRPVVSEYEHSDEYPEPLLRRMGELGFFGLLIPEEYGGLGVDFSTFAEIQIELSQGWMSLSGVLTSLFTSAWMITTFGTDEQRITLLPRLASGELRIAFSMTEPDAGSDVQAIRTRATRSSDQFTIDGTKTWTTHGLHSGAVMLIAVTDPTASPRYRGMSAFVIEKPPGISSVPGLEIPPSLRKLGYKGIEATELVFNSYRVPVSSVLGGEAGVGSGFKYFMAGMEVGRLSVAASATGIATDAFRRAIAYAQQREAFGLPIAKHQAIQIKLAA